jgi:hypothetical protein
MMEAILEPSDRNYSRAVAQSSRPPSLLGSGSLLVPVTSQQDVWEGASSGDAKRQRTRFGDWWTPYDGERVRGRVGLRAAPAQIHGLGHGTLLSCLPGSLGYFEGEEIGERYVLERTCCTSSPSSSLWRVRRRRAI